MTKTYDFAGEEVKVTEMMTADSGEEIKEQESSESSKVEAKKRYTMAHVLYSLFLSLLCTTPSFLSFQNEKEGCD